MLIQFIRNLNFRKKFFITCLLVSLIPVLFLGVFCYQQMKSALIDREKTALSDTLNHEASHLNTELNTYIQALQHIAWNNNIRIALLEEYDSTMDMYHFYKDTLDPLFAATESFNPRILCITLYTNVDINPHGQTLRPLEELEKFPWYAEVSDDYKHHWICSMEESSLFLIGQIYNLPGDIQAFVRLEIDYASTFSTLNTLYDQSYGIQLLDQTGTQLYQFHTEDMAVPLSYDQLNTAFSQDFSKGGYIIEAVSDICDDWTVYLYRPTESILRSTTSIIFSVFFMICLCLICVITASSFLSTSMVRPLEQLAANMHQIEQGTIVSTVTSHSRDEIGNLTAKFNEMVNQLNQLIEELSREKVLQKEHELRALQAQINPHFLYNSLSLINSKAILADQPEIEQMAQYLSTFYRTTLNKGKSITTVRGELNNVRSYLNIQLLMHSGSFDVNYEIEEEILDYQMPNLLLQPLVENAVLHGIDCITTGERGTLRLHGCLKGTYLIFRISDNGPGIPASQMNTILTANPDRGYGARNVHQRVQLAYGSAYGLTYESQPGQGTAAVLTLPANGSLLDSTHDNTCDQILL